MILQSSGGCANDFSGDADFSFSCAALKDSWTNQENTKMRNIALQLRLSSCMAIIRSCRVSAKVNVPILRCECIYRNLQMTVQRVDRF
jgi:hypothetical protein